MDSGEAGLVGECSGQQVKKSRGDREKVRLVPRQGEPGV